jgi:hypothetical protein
LHVHTWEENQRRREDPRWYLEEPAPEARLDPLIQDAQLPDGPGCPSSQDETGCNDD